MKSYYEFRCASGHDVTRIGTVAMRGTITCLQCEHVRVQFRFQELLSERGIVCHEEPISVKRHANASPVRLDMNGLLRRKIPEDHRCPQCAKNELAAGLLHADGWNVFMMRRRSVVVAVWPTRISVSPRITNGSAPKAIDGQPWCNAEPVESKQWLHSKSQCHASADSSAGINGVCYWRAFAVAAIAVREL
ncbi:hypothetical protein [Burkholderia sp. BC1]|uniref:hypothetical protein n=1 Tax=Burkholderia sp. BC1 TaxID=1095370 RepID=UPI004043D515|nr:hypothetical protein [Burkholderia multivorans]